MNRHVFALALALASVPASAAWAAPPSSVRDALAEGPRARFDEGSRLYKAARYAEAREAFLAAHAQSADPRILFNVAVCDKALGRYARAIVTLRRSLATTDRPLPADYVRRASEAIATLSRYVAFVSIVPSVEGATITVDGEPLRESPVPVETGSHEIVATKDGFERLTQSLVVKAGDELRVTLDLVPSTRAGTVKLSCVGAERCEFRIGDEVIGTAPATLIRPAGSYTVRAYADGKPFGEQRIDVTNGKEIEVAIVGRPPAVARLRVTSDDPTDLVTVDGKPAGRSGAQLDVEPGEHHIVLSRADGTAKTIDVLLRDNETRDLRITLEAKKGTSPWWFVGGGAVIAGIAATAIVLSSSRSTKFEGNASGTLNPYVIPASAPGAFR
jgi:hypothetical protein